MAGIDGLVAALRRQVIELEDDLRARVDGADPDTRQPGVGDRWRAEHTHALKAQRTASSWQAWRDERVTQAAVAWVLVTVFARYCEDRRLVSRQWIAGPDANARRQALDARHAYFAEHPEHTDREWIKQVVDHFAGLDATKGLVDEYSPLRQVAPSGDAARALLEFWWEQDDFGALRWTFGGVDTRFLGDIYQDLSEFAKKTYALLQTPEFVEEFILDQTLEPALAERPLEGFTVIDPTCGSGHFLLGAFHRLLERWQREAPALGPRMLVQKALEGVYGVDINPFAVAIARFRLIVAALEASGDKSIETLIGIELNLATGDSLLWGARQQTISDDLLTLGQEQFAYTTENADALRAILQREHDVVVGNPPYIQVSDSALSGIYRALYSTCFKQYALTVPFMELFFELARTGERGVYPGWVGQITANSFMKRDFGQKLVENYLPRRDMRAVIDSEGAWIPGHNSDGTSTVIIVGTGGPQRRGEVRVILSKGRRESRSVGNSGAGPYWRSLVEHLGQRDYSDEWIDVVDLPRISLAQHPWSLSGGGAVELRSKIECAHVSVLGDLINVAGRTCHTGSDDAYFASPGAWRRHRVDDDHVVPLVTGDAIREWLITPDTEALFPYSKSLKASLDDPATARLLWPMKSILDSRRELGGTHEEIGLTWYEWSRWHPERFSVDLGIAFAFVATHNHFVLDRGGKVFKQSAPVIKLPRGRSENDHLELLGVLNSSTVGFWLRENTQPKGGAANITWSRTREYPGTIVKKIPLPPTYPLDSARIIETLAQELATQTPEAVACETVPTANALELARKESERIRALMIAHQEELDWECYRLYGLIDEDLTYPGDLPGIALGERAFEIVLARAVENGEHTEWFERHRSTPITEIPTHLPADYQTLIRRRLDAIAINPNLRLLEKPEHKRRWAVEPWVERVTEALRDWLLDRVEDRALWFDRDDRPTPQSVSQLADRLDRDPDFRAVLRLWAGSAESSTGAALAKLLDEEGVPYLAALRYKPAGLEKRAAWEHTWALQRREDAGEKLDAPIPVPPKYKPADFLKTYWSRRGKLDVPKERFISYPDAGRTSDTTQLLGWAGWDHAEQALALAGLIDERIQDGWGADKLTPMLAGLAELLPWVQQWHGEIDPEFGESVADTVGEELRSRCAQIGVTVDELAAWRPPASTRGRRTKKESTPA
ncbi:BREX-2 system adenine-specific DNA-methyltransferase PglX [Rhodococcus sp. BP-252]|uniref:BREX-2 system adenine-specific DNA-methyltransferase PglX n=1 Tax=unclassified Rhodococcus (in: high G+C Gram-positive bacteria) TaxID=192944 RepID=UPI001C9AC1B2|nr:MULTISPECIES: BREX-2 system adenine-specific DNA-methyltransferase PglX [unclassified Rhodococcus (in: high G+C Gram-positive bacteria)]MBY6413365.1 BREX-2 system adenine-specific DNA-methyltransferase PglX [Rhodococcus sp. BP-320]MBY6418031.1 BREX-2 system adenine-specific DNA-methyltransferase PglX [Rhodococcus sp. BP-321]MBY6422279.1 BREX-2 system adenine-specific DNA-methyltransferase PglX [Rhodococcus sp. BP-324]MBY6428080.1 BREX-2 system adenine-specific DNA-methyltransferase PglX [Rho